MIALASCGLTPRCLLSMHSDEATMTFGPVFQFGDDMQRAEFPFDQLQGSEDRPLGAAGTDTSRTLRYHFDQRLDLGLARTDGGIGAGNRAKRRLGA